MGSGERPQAATYTARDVAALLDVSENHVRELEKTGRLPFPSLRLGDRVVFPRGAVDAALGDHATAREAARRRAELERLLAIAERVAALAGGFSELHALLIAVAAALATQAERTSPGTPAENRSDPRALPAPLAATDEACRRTRRPGGRNSARTETQP